LQALLVGERIKLGLAPFNTVNPLLTYLYFWLNKVGLNER